MAERYSGEDVQRIVARAFEFESELRAESPTAKPGAEGGDEADLDRIAESIVVAIRTEPARNQDAQP